MKCEICGLREARYVCSECGRRVCEECLEPNEWKCIKCIECGEREFIGIGDYENTEILWKTTLIGFIIIFIGIILIMVSSIIMGGTVAGGIIILPFIPIFFMNGPYEIGIILTATILVMTIIFLIILWKIFK
ncbi:MAG: B-box zinc finger protein [Candidatus Methanomethylicia archaeon]